MSDTKIVIGYDGTNGAHDALAAGRLIGTLTPTATRVVHAYPYTPALAGIADVAGVLRSQAEAVLATAREALGEESGAEFVAIPTTSPPRVLHRMAAEWGADFVVIGSTERASRFGRVSEQVLHGAPCPVLVAPSGYRERDPRLETIAVAFNGSDEAGPTLREAARLAALAGAELRVIDVVDVSHGYYPPDWSETIPQYREKLRRRGERQVGRAIDELSYPASAVVVPGDAADVLVERSGQLDLLVMGSRDHGPLRRLIFGSVSRPVVRDAACPVLVLPRTANGREMPPSHTTPGVAAAL